MCWDGTLVSRLEFHVLPHHRWYTFLSWIRDMQDLQVTRHATYEREPYLLHWLRIMWLETFRQHDQDRFPGASWQEKQEQDRLIVARMIVCMLCICSPWSSRADTVAMCIICLFSVIHISIFHLIPICNHSPSIVSAVSNRNVLYYLWHRRIYSSWSQFPAMTEYISYESTCTARIYHRYNSIKSSDWDTRMPSCNKRTVLI